MSALPVVRLHFLQECKLLFAVIYKNIDSEEIQCLSCCFGRELSGRRKAEKRRERTLVEMNQEVKRHVARGGVPRDLLAGIASLL